MGSRIETPTRVSDTVIGVDIIEIGRIERAISKWHDAFLKRIYTPAELNGHYNVSSMAARFAAKEAVMKALGVGIGAVSWRDIEILRKKGGASLVNLHGRALARSKEIGIFRFSISMSHSREYAVAFVVGHAV